MKDELLDRSDETFLIWPNNVKVWTAFLTVSTQLVFCETFGWRGFDYTNVKSGFDLAGISTTPSFFEKFRFIETEVIKQLNNKRKNE